MAAAVILAVRLIPGSTPPAAAGHRTGPAASAGSSATTRDHGRRTGGAGAGSTNAVRDLTLQDLGNVGLNEVSFTTDGKLLTDTSPGGHVYVWDVATGKLVHTVNTSSEVSVDPAVSPDGTLAASSVSATSGGVYLWDVATGKPITTLSNPKLPVGIDALLFSPDGKFLAVGDGGHIYIWNVAARTVTASIATPGTLINTLAFSPNSMLLATSTVTGTTTVNPVQLWAVATGDQISTPLAGNPDVEQGGVQGLAFSPDGKILAASGRGGIYLWGVTTSSLTGTLNRPGEGILPLDYSPDGTLLAVGDWASATRAFVLNAATGTVLHTFTDPGEYPVSDVTFSPDGKLLAFADRVGEIYVKVTSQLVGG
ncbi:MAG: WD40 repeat domain-containing protein [Streptosporangiaceae bacterium]